MNFVQLAILLRKKELQNMRGKSLKMFVLQQLKYAKMDNIIILDNYRTKPRKDIQRFVIDVDPAIDFSDVKHYQAIAENNFRNREVVFIYLAKNLSRWELFKIYFRSFITHFKLKK